MTTRQVASIAGSVVLALSLVTAVGAFAGAAKAPSRTARTTVTGKHLYRQFCGKCHALAQALSAGFGGENQLGGPSFNELRVPYSFSIAAVTEPTGGHEALRKRMTPKEVRQVALYVARTTRHNPIPALPTDG